MGSMKGLKGLHEPPNIVHKVADIFLRRVYGLSSDSQRGDSGNCARTVLGSGKGPEGLNGRGRGGHGCGDQGGADWSWLSGEGGYMAEGEFRSTLWFLAGVTGGSKDGGRLGRGGNHHEAGLPPSTIHRPRDKGTKRPGMFLLVIFQPLPQRT